MSCISRENLARSASTAIRARCSRSTSACAARSARASSCACRSVATRPSATLAATAHARKSRPASIWCWTWATRKTKTSRLGAAAATAIRSARAERYRVTVYTQIIKLRLLLELSPNAHSTVQDASTTQYTVNGALRRHTSATACKVELITNSGVRYDRSSRAPDRGERPSSSTPSPSSTS